MFGHHVLSSPLKNVCHGCVSRAEVRERTGFSHCRDGSNGLFVLEAASRRKWCLTPTL